MEIELIDNQESKRFETVIDGNTAFIDYTLAPGEITVHHTTVPEALQGKGIAGRLTEKVLEFIAAKDLKLIPLCPYMQGYLKKNPHHQKLVK